MSADLDDDSTKKSNRMPRVSFAVTPNFKRQMKVAAGRESRTTSSWVRWLIRRELRAKGLLREVDPTV